MTLTLTEQVSMLLAKSVSVYVTVRLLVKTRVVLALTGEMVKVLTAVLSETIRLGKFEATNE